jgi:hypothetical protein
MDKGTITGHFIAHWGVPSNIFPFSARGIEAFAVLEFAPKGLRRSWRYATNGMSSYRQFCPDEHIIVRTEIYASTNDRADWVHDLLIAMASYPIDCQTYFAEGDTVNVGQSIDQKSSCYTGIMIAPPQPPTLGLVSSLQEKVLVHQLIGLLPSEVQFSEEHCGGKIFWQKLISDNEHLLDVARLPVV